MKLCLSRVLQRKEFAAGILLCAFSIVAQSAEIHVPANLVAGRGFSVSFNGTGNATLYLIAPDHVLKRDINLDSELNIHPQDVRAAGRYKIIVCSDLCTSSSFEVRAAQPANLNFFLHPSRVPVSSPASINAFAFVFDPYFNLVLTPSDVNFRIKPASGAVTSRQVATRNGVAWISMNSTSRGGPVQVTAEIGSTEEARVVQQVASEACGLHMNAAQNRNVVTIETNPVRDCSGNPLPDGTIVSFTKVDDAGRSTIDVPIKKDVARAQFSVSGPARVSIACGVVLGNEIALK